MRIEYRVNSPQKPGWIARILLSLATVALVVVGFFFLTAALIAGALIALVVGVRFWWALRKFKRAQAAAGKAHGTGANDGSTPLDGEYQVVERETTVTRLPPSGASNTPPER